tara:strand:+ start:320 stop:643 length:324 start_codon:yes stop_codon:yes gene_type:complete
MIGLSWITKSIALVLFLTSVFFSTGAFAFVNQIGTITCYDREITEALLKQEKAVLIGMGIDSGGGLLQLYKEPGGDFHIIVIPPKDTTKACPLTWGKNWINTLDTPV